MEKENLLLNVNCPVCSSEQISFVEKYRYRSAVFANCSIVRCNACGMFFAAPMPSEKELAVYNAGYFENAHGGISMDPVTQAFLSAISLIRVEYVQAFQKKNKITVERVLEIGPGSGYFAQHWLKKNPGTDYTAVESDQTCYEKLDRMGVKIYSDSYEIPSGKPFDMVVISHVLEHTSNPSAFIQNCTEQLHTGGLLFIEVPCKDFEHKDNVEPHLLFFDKAPMQLFLSRMGFEKIQLTYHGNTIADHKKPLSFFKKIKNKIRNRLLIKGIVLFSGTNTKGLENMSMFEKAVIEPYKAHIEQTVPSWWLRAVAVKK